MTPKVSKHNRVLALIALMAVASFAVGWLVYVASDSDAKTVAAGSERLNTLRDMTYHLTGDIYAEKLTLDAYVLSGDPSALRLFTAAESREDELLAGSAVATVGLPGVEAAIRALTNINEDWRTNVATPTIAAIGSNDSAALASFAARANNDHTAVETSVGMIDEALTRAAAALALRKAASDDTVALGTVVAFAFMMSAFGVSMFVVRRFGRALEHDAREASVLNRFTELTSFANDDHEVATANLRALDRLTRPDAAVTHILNRSMDRAVPEASSGEAVPEILPLRALDRCAGVVRGSIYVTDDLSDDLAVHCPIYPASVGTLACIPLASGEPVGAVHLYWRQPHALPLDRRSSVARIAEHAALAIGNRRLMTALHGQANTDPRTGLANSRAFDLALEAALAASGPGGTVSVLMLDVDHFKQFNDRYGHPAGDEALRAFGVVLRSCMRENDLAARYGGEEFAVMLPGNGAAASFAIAERIRARIESTIISIAPGITDHITVSIGCATAPEQGLDRITLLRLADEALYEAKGAGRNRVAAAVRAAGAPTVETLSTEAAIIAVLPAA